MALRYNPTDPPPDQRALEEWLSVFFRTLKTGKEGN